MNYALKYEALREVMNKAEHRCTVITFDHKTELFKWVNTNKLLNKYFVASKTGITPAAGPCLVSAFRFGPYEARGCLIDSKSTTIRWKEMATILLWQFDYYLKTNKIGAYNGQIVAEYKLLRDQQRLQKEHAKKIKDASLELKLLECREYNTNGSDLKLQALSSFGSTD
jgi:D-alanyl-D-alanine carboxypeptidase